MSKIEMGKKYKTREGKAVEILGVNGRKPYPIYGYISDDSVISIWAENGKFIYNSERPDNRDLVVVKETKTVTMWVNVYSTGVSVLYSSRYYADREGFTTRIACVPVNITYTEGEGLES